MLKSYWHVNVACTMSLWGQQPCKLLQWRQLLGPHSQARCQFPEALPRYALSSDRLRLPHTMYSSTACAGTNIFPFPFLGSPVMLEVITPASANDPSSPPYHYETWLQIYEVKGNTK